MYDTLRLIFTVSEFTYCAVAALTAFTGVLILAMTDSRAIAVTFSPAAAFGGFCGIYAFRSAGIMLSADKDANMLIGASFGMFVAVSIMLLLIRFYYSAIEIRKPVTKSKLASR